MTIISNKNGSSQEVANPIDDEPREVSIVESSELRESGISEPVLSRKTPLASEIIKSESQRNEEEL